MPSARRPSARSLAAAAAVMVMCAAVAVTLLASRPARAASIGQLQQQITAGQGRISGLSGAVGAASTKLTGLSANISSLQQRIVRLQRQLNGERTQLLALRAKLSAARTRLAQLEAYLARAESVLNQQLVGTYEHQRPDIVTVVLEATGFDDLLNRINYAERIQRQDLHVIRQVRSARKAVAAQATRLGALEARQQALTEEVLAQRNSLAQDRGGLLKQRVAVAWLRGVKAKQLAGVRGQVASLQGQLSRLQAAQAAAAAASSTPTGTAGAPSGAGTTGAPAAPGPIQVSSGGGFVFPLPKGSASPPGSWSEDQGVDISAPGDTPELAVCSGTIVLHGIGGFGPWAPVLHCDAPVGGYSYVYYGHAGPLDQLAVGTHVGAGQVMSSVGPGIVGISTGPHLEIGFADSSGAPIGGGSASTMMSLLQGSY